MGMEAKIEADEKEISRKAPKKKAGKEQTKKNIFKYSKVLEV